MRKYLIGVMAGGLLGALTLSGVSSAAVTNLTITSPVSPAKQDKKIRGPVTTTFTSTDTHDGSPFRQVAPVACPGDRDDRV
jgi:hypothetical protein